MAPNITRPSGRAQRPIHDRASARLAVHEWAHNTAQRNQVAIVTIDGRDYVDLRKFFRGHDGYLPTRKGWTIPLHQFEDLEQAVHLLRPAVEARRHLRGPRDG